jgi:acetyl-CoA acetyltransferase
VAERDRRAVIAGIGESTFHSGSASEYRCGLEAILAALADAGLGPADVNGVSRLDADRVTEIDLTAGAGVRSLAFYNTVAGGPGGIPALLRMAAMAVEAGLADVVLAYHARGRAERRAAAPSVEDAAELARWHMTSFGTTPEHLAAVAAAMRRHAAANPRALRRQPITAAHYRASPVVAAPLRALDCGAGDAGAGCLVVTARERARDLRGTPVSILGTMQALAPWPEATPGGREAVLARGMRELYAEAGITAADVDVAYLHDGFTPFVLVGLEDCGLCPRGESGAFVAGGGILAPEGALPVNTNGGQLGEACLDGVNDLIEAVRQLRGESTSPVRDARVALVAGPPLGPTGAVVLGGPGG